LIKGIFFGLIKSIHKKAFVEKRELFCRFICFAKKRLDINKLRFIVEFELLKYRE